MSLTTNSIHEWFHPNGDLKENFKHCVDFGTYYAKTVQRCPIFESNSIMKDKICVIFREKKQTNIYMQFAFNHS